MKVNLEKIEQNVANLTVEVPEEEVEKALQTAYLKVVKRVNVPGFRKGKVPRKILEARFGKEVLYEDAMDVLFSNTYGKAIDEAKIEPVDRPEVHVEQFEAGKPFIYKVQVTVKPEVTLGQYKDLEVSRPSAEVTDEDVAKRLEATREQYARLVPPDNEQVANGDRVTVDFEGFIDGKPFEGGKGTDYPLVIGSNTFIPGFEDQLVGAKAGEEREIKVQFPADYRVENLAGKDAVFKVTVKDIKRKKLPELNDDFAKEISEFDTLDEFKTDLKNKMKESAEAAANREFENRLIEEVANKATVEIPAVMVDHEVNHRLDELSDRLRYQGLTLEQYLQFTGSDLDTLKNQLRGSAEKKVRIDLVLEKIAEVEKIEPTEDEINAEINKMAESYKKPIDELRKTLEENGALDSIKYGLTMQKTIDFLVAHNKAI